MDVFAFPFHPKSGRFGRELNPRSFVAGAEATVFFKPLTSRATYKLDEPHWYALVFKTPISHFFVCGKMLSLFLDYVSPQIQRVYLLGHCDCLFISFALPFFLLAFHALLR